MKGDASLLGNTMKDVAVVLWRSNGQQRALELINDVNNKNSHMHIRWVWLDALPKDPYQSEVSEDKLDLLLRGQELSFKGQDPAGNKVLYTYVPVIMEKERPGAIEIFESLSSQKAYTKAIVRRTFVLTGLLLLLSILVFVVVGIVMLGRPVRRLIEKMQRVGAGDFSGPLHLRRHDELGELARGLNTMCEQLADAREKVRVETDARIAALDQLRHEDRLKTVGKLASGVAHELGTPLNVISARARMIVKGNLSPKETAQNANSIIAASERITVIIRQLLDFARHRSGQKTAADILQVVRRSLDFVTPLARAHKVQLCLAAEDETAVARVDAEQIQQVLTNIIINSLQATEQGGRVEVGIRHEKRRAPDGDSDFERDYLCIYILDQGAGISEENISHIFEPFFTTKEVGKGTGLGLSIAFGIVSEHGGWIDVKSEPGKGSCFSVYLPEEEH